jgi:hypothetical protein
MATTPAARRADDFLEELRKAGDDLLPWQIPGTPVVHSPSEHELTPDEAVEFRHNLPA